MRRPRAGTLSTRPAPARSAPAVWRVALVLAGVLASVTGCGVAANDVAATVGPTTISASLVNELASSSAFMGAMASQAIAPQREGVLDGSSARQVLAFLIQKEVLAQEVDRWGAEVTQADRRSAEDMIEQQAPRLKGSHRELVAEFLATRDALQARLTSLDAAADTVLRRFYDAVPTYWDRVCMDAVVVRTADVDAARRALRRGTAIGELPEKVKDAQVVVTREQCLPVATLPVALRDRLGSTRVGALVGPVPSVFPGQDVVLWLKVSSRSRLSFGDARGELSELVSSVLQRGVDQWLTLRANELVTVDPRYGSSIVIGQEGVQVVPPPVPVGAVVGAVDDVADATGSATP